jgi:EARP and GARP complex-interacting protein 1
MHALDSRPTSVSWENIFYYTTSTEFNSIDIQSNTRSKLLELDSIAVCRIDPHHKFLVAVGYSDSLIVYDTRDSSNRYTISPVHSTQVFDVDFNPNNPYHLASCGRDYSIKFWDIRKQGCLKTISEHNHYVWQIKYNSYHDQLLVSASSDNSAALHRVVSASSAPVDESFFEKENDMKILTVEAFEDSVYACAWSSGEAWHFASVSYDGKVVVTAVPSEEKYKILL